MNANSQIRVKTGGREQRHQRVKSDGVHMINSVFQSYSGRIPSIPGINHKRGKSGQNEGFFKTTLEEIEDGGGVNSTYNDLKDEEVYAVDQTAFIEQQEHNNQDN